MRVISKELDFKQKHVKSYGDGDKEKAKFDNNNPLHSGTIAKHHYIRAEIWPSFPEAKFLQNEVADLV